MDSINYNCIICPIGCALSLSKEDSGELDVTGAGCRRGIQYAKSEYVNPLRMLTSTVVVYSSGIKMLPVKSERPLPKDMLLLAMKEIHKVRVNPPIQVGDPVIRNILGLGTDIVATRSVLT